MQLKRGQPALVITTAGFFVPADFERSGGMSEEFHYHPDTLAVHVGQRRSAEGEMSEPIFASTSFVFASAAEAAARFSGEKPGNIYSRFTNPTVQVFEQRIAAMEGGERAVATGSGMAAILATCLGLLKSGDHLVARNGLFGSIVVRSATKYIDGQGRAIGGAVVGREKEVGGDVYGVLRTAGPSLSPFHAWLYLKGLETLSVRMQAHCANALALAQWLEQQPAVERVFYPGLASHPQHALAQRQQRGYGGLLSFEVRGGREAARKVIDNTRLIAITANLGDTKSTITHPSTPTHGRLSPEARAAAGIKVNLVLIAVGLEDTVDLNADLARGLR